MSNTNEKAQSAREFIKQFLRSHKEFQHTGNYNEFMDEVSDHRLNIARWMTKYAEYRNAELESDLAKSQEKCKAYEEALNKITGTNWVNGEYFGRTSAQLHLTATKIAEQALKPNDPTHTKLSNTAKCIACNGEFDNKLQQQLGICGKCMRNSKTK
jgi:hypothetical protein